MWMYPILSTWAVVNMLSCIHSSFACRQTWPARDAGICMWQPDMCKAGPASNFRPARPKKYAEDAGPARPHCHWQHGRYVFRSLCFSRNVPWLSINFICRFKFSSFIVSWPATVNGYRAVYCKYEHNVQSIKFNANACNISLVDNVNHGQSMLHEHTTVHL